MFLNIFKNGEIATSATQTRTTWETETIDPGQRGNTNISETYDDVRKPRAHFYEKSAPRRKTVVYKHDSAECSLGI